MLERQLPTVCDQIRPQKNMVSSDTLSSKKEFSLPSLTDAEIQLQRMSQPLCNNNVC